MNQYYPPYWVPQRQRHPAWNLLWAVPLGVFVSWAMGHLLNLALARGWPEPVIFVLGCCVVTPWACLIAAPIIGNWRKDRYDPDWQTRSIRREMWLEGPGKMILFAAVIFGFYVWPGVVLTGQIVCIIFVPLIALRLLWAGIRVLFMW